jgi:chorismate mutase/prephenate dehydratase
MAATEVAFLGPLGTYSHLVATKRFGKTSRMVPLPTVMDVCEYVAEKPARRGIVPLENSSGGAIYETVDILLGGKISLCIIEELALNVQLALLGVAGEPIKHLYSHFAPLEHCDPWITRHLPEAEKHVVLSTAVAAEQAARERNAAALGSRTLATMHGLQILEFPVQADIINLTMFLAIGGKRKTQPGATKTILAVRLPNTAGSLCTFLDTFRCEKVNLSRLISRPIRGCPREYAFLVEITGSPSTAAFKRALAEARMASAELRVVGSYPVRKPYKS